MKRRHFLQTALTLAAAPAIAPPVFAAGDPVKRLYERSLVIDALAFAHE